MLYKRVPEISNLIEKFKDRFVSLDFFVSFFGNEKKKRTNNTIQYFCNYFQNKIQDKK